MAKSGSLIIGLFLGVLSIAVSAQAQSTAPDCPLSAEATLETLDTTCAGLELNAVCYGNPKVKATFARSGRHFHQVGDRQAPP
jgi:hypothetical protein